jgi:DNA polymerase III epsilon subunit-like protein
VHGITTARAIEKGQPLPQVVAEFGQVLARSDAVIAHNLEFDETVVRCEAYRVGVQLPFDDVVGFCTMKATTELCRLPFASGRGYKYPTLAELHTYCFGQSHKQAHDSVGDVDAVVRVVQYLLKSKQMVVELNQSRKQC